MTKPLASLTNRTIANPDLARLHLDERAALYKAAAAIRSTLDFDEVLQEIAKQLCTALDATSAYIFSFDVSKGICTVLTEFFSVNACTKERKSDIGKIYKIAEELTGDVHALHSGQPMLHYLNDPDLDPRTRVELEDYGVQSALTIPLQINGQTVAFTEIWESRYHRDFNEHEIALAVGITQHTPVAIENARLYAETQRNLREQTALRTAISTISSTLDLTTVLSRIAKQMGLAIDSTSAYICDWIADSRSMKVLADYYGPEASSAEIVSNLGVEYSLERDEEFESKMLDGVTVTEHIDNPDISDADRAHLEQYGVKSVIYIPLIVWGKLTAIAELWDSRQRRYFTIEEIDLAKRIAQHGAVAIQNARLYEKTQVEIRERKRAEQQLLHDAFHDQLTSLPNRALLLNRLEQILMRSRRYQSHSYAVLFLDLDRFKVVNDSLGHSAGDELLIAVGDRLKTCLREVDTIARFGGDEFTILLEEVIDIGNAVRVTKRILKSFSDPFHIGDHKVFTTASIGIVLGDERYEDCEALLRDADIAMYQAKEMGLSQYAVFNQDMHTEAINLLQLESELRKAFKQEEFVLYYQPIANLATSAIIGYEALIRWQHPTKGLVQPIEFIPLAEETGLIIPIGYWVLREACHQLAMWHQTYPRFNRLSVSVNLSGRQLKDPKLPSRLRSILQETHLDPTCLALEITESVIIEDYKIARKTLSDLKAMGVCIHMDDFGAGYSSLNVLCNLPLDAIKIDCSFTQNIERDQKNRDIVNAIIQLGSKLGKIVIVEGIETRSTYELLREMGSDFGQGYLWSKPKHPQDLILELRTGTAPLPDLEKVVMPKVK